MASFLLHIPSTLRNPRVVSASSFSNGSLPTSSNQAGKGGPIIVELPLNQIRRPLMRTRSNDPQKVQELMDSIAQIGLQVPVSPSNLFWFLQLITPGRLIVGNKDGEKVGFRLL